MTPAAASSLPDTEEPPSPISSGSEATPRERQAEIASEIAAAQEIDNAADVERYKAAAGLQRD